jgi:prefoldin subunit 5
MIEGSGRAGASRVFFDGAVVAAILLQIGFGIYWAGQTSQQLSDMHARVDALETQESARNVSLTDISVRLGRMEQKLSDIGQKVGVP